MTIPESIDKYKGWESRNTPDNPFTGDTSLISFLKNNEFVLNHLHEDLHNSGCFRASGNFDDIRKAVKGPRGAFFAKDTAEDFHKLLLATFIRLTLDLQIFKSMKNKLSQNGKVFHRIKLHIHLLLSILASSSFRAYIEFTVQSNRINLIPLFENRLTYRSSWIRLVSTLRSQVSEASILNT